MNLFQHPSSILIHFVMVNDCDRAVEYFKSLGMTPVEETRKVVDGKTVFIYFKEEIAGFAIHLNQA